MINYDLFLDKSLKINLNKENFDFAYLVSGVNATVMQNI